MNRSAEFLTRSPRLAAFVAAGGLALAGCGSNESRPTQVAANPEAENTPAAAQTVQATESHAPEVENTPAPAQTSEVSPFDESSAEQKHRQEALALLCELSVGYINIPNFSNDPQPAGKIFLDAMETTPEIWPAGVTIDDIRANMDYVTLSIGDMRTNVDQEATFDTMVPHMGTVTGRFDNKC